MTAELVELEAFWGKRRFSFRVVREDRKTLRIAVEPDGRVSAYVPLTAAPDEVVTRVARRGGWITRQMDRFDLWRPRTPERQYVSGETHLFLGKQYRLLISSADRTTVGIDGDRIAINVRPDATFIQRRATLQHWYKLQAHRIFPGMLDGAWPHFAKLGIARPKLIVRQMPRRWGSFTTAGNLVLNSELIQASPQLIEYVVLHELAHGVHPHHGPEWQAVMTDTMPDWRQRKAELERQLL